jgi:hypothetical protein
MDESRRDGTSGGAATRVSDIQPKPQANWTWANLGALLLGVAARRLMPMSRPIPVDLRYGRIATFANSFSFQVLAAVGVSIVFVFAIFRLRFVGAWCVFLSFMVGGMLTTIVLTTMHEWIGR